MASNVSESGSQIERAERPSRQAATAGQSTGESSGVMRRVVRIPRGQWPSSSETGGQQERAEVREEPCKERGAGDKGACASSSEQRGPLR